MKIKIISINQSKLCLGGEVLEGRERAGVPGEHAEVNLQADDDVLEPQAGRSTHLQVGVTLRPRFNVYFSAFCFSAIYFS